MDKKQQLIIYGKKLVQSGLVASTWGNISIKDGENNIYITPSGIDYLSLVPEDIVKVNINGNVLEGERKPSSELLLHLKIYQERTDVNAVVHTHSIYASAYAVARKEIPPLVEDMVQVVGGSVEVAQYALPGTEELAYNAVRTLAEKGAVLLANHGAIGVGSDIEEAFKVCLLVEKAAQIGIAAAILGNTHSISAAHVEIMRDGYLNNYGQKAGGD